MSTQASDLDTPSELTFERSLYVGGQITAILYGEYIYLASDTKSVWSLARLQWQSLYKIDWHDQTQAYS